MWSFWLLVMSQTSIEVTFDTLYCESCLPPSPKNGLTDCIGRSPEDTPKCYKDLMGIASTHEWRSRTGHVASFNMCICWILVTHQARTADLGNVLDGSSDICWRNSFQTSKRQHIMHVKIHQNPLKIRLVGLSQKSESNWPWRITLERQTREKSFHDVIESEMNEFCCWQSRFCVRALEAMTPEILHWLVFSTTQSNPRTE
jgi:hypothetical protein